MAGSRAAERVFGKDFVEIVGGYAIGKPDDNLRMRAELRLCLPAGFKESEDQQKAHQPRGEECRMTRQFCW